MGILGGRVRCRSGIDRVRASSERDAAQTGEIHQGSGEEAFAKHCQMSRGSSKRRSPQLSSTCSARLFHPVEPLSTFASAQSQGSGAQIIATRS